MFHKWRVADDSKEYYSVSCVFAFAQLTETISNEVIFHFLPKPVFMQFSEVFSVMYIEHPDFRK